MFCNWLTSGDVTEGVYTINQDGEITGIDRASAQTAYGTIYFLEHSPSDRVCPFWMARKAESSLKDHEASVRLNTYQGGHGWQGDVYGRIRNGVARLEGAVAKETPDASSPE